MHLGFFLFFVLFLSAVTGDWNGGLRHRSLKLQKLRNFHHLSFSFSEWQKRKDCHSGLQHTRRFSTFLGDMASGVNSQIKPFLAQFEQKQCIASGSRASSDSQIESVSRSIMKPKFCQKIQLTNSSFNYVMKTLY